MVSPMSIHQADKNRLTPNAVEVTQSDITAFLRCRRLYHYSSTLGLGLAPVSAIPHFALGTLLHNGLEQYYLGNENYLDFYVNQAQQVLEDPSNSLELSQRLLEDFIIGKYLLQAYPTWDKAKNRFEVVSVEQRLTHRLVDGTPGVFVSMRYDMLVRDLAAPDKNSLWLVDFKSVRRMPSGVEEEVWGLRDQSLFYQAVANKVLKQQGTSVAGIIYIFLWKRMPTAPEVLSSGELSRRKDIVTTVEKYLEAIRENSLDASRYSEFMGYLKQTYDGKWFRRLTFSAEESQQERYLERLQKIIGEMLRPDLPIYESVSTLSCPHCDFREPCFTQLQGGDDRAVLNLMYTKADIRE